MFNLRLFFILFLWCASYTNIEAQKSNLDSLSLALKKAATPQEQSQLLNKIGAAYYNKQVYLDSAYYFTNQAFILAKENKLFKEQARALTIRANINSFLKEYKIAIDEYTRALEIYQALGDTDNLFGCYNNIGATYFELKEFDTAIEYYYKALAIARKKNKKVSIAIATMNIAETFYVNKNYKSAKLEFEESLSILKQTKFNPPTVHLFYARTLKALGELDEAETEGVAAFKISEQKQDFKYASESARLLSEVYQEQTKYEKALTFQKKYASYANKVNESKEKNEIEKLVLNFELKEKTKQLAHASQKETYMQVIWILVVVGILLLILLIHRQRRVTRMTCSIHDIQKRLVESELIKREKKLELVSSLKAGRKQD